MRTRSQHDKQALNCIVFGAICILLSIIIGTILCLIYGGMMVSKYNGYNGPQLDNDVKGTCIVSDKYITNQTLVYNVTAVLEGDSYKLQIFEKQSNKKSAQTALDNSNINTAPCWFSKTKKGTYIDGTWNYVDSSTNGWGIVLLIIGCISSCFGLTICYKLIKSIYSSILGC